jgi:hypothetical protein
VVNRSGRSAWVVAESDENWSPDAGRNDAVRVAYTLAASAGL